MDLEKYVHKYNNVSAEEIKKIIDTHCYWSEESQIERHIRQRHEAREKVKKNGRSALLPQPLVHVLSVSVCPNNKNEDKLLAIYGRIHIEFLDSNSGEKVVHEIYNRGRDLMDTCNKLTLRGPDFSSWTNTCISLVKSQINVTLFDGNHNVFAEKCSDFDDTQTEKDYEEVKTKVIQCEQGFLNVRYIVIPFGVYCRMDVRFYNRRQASEEPYFLNVNGKIVVRYANTYGNYFEEECILFDKKDNDFERVEISNGKSLQLARFWVTLPAYSSLIIGVDLSECESKRNIVNGTLKLLPLQALGSSDSFLLDDFSIEVSAAWMSPEPLGRCSRLPRMLEFSTKNIKEIDNKQEISKEDIENMDTDQIDEPSSDGPSSDESDDELSSNVKPLWILNRHKEKLWSSPAVEIFSIFIGRENLKVGQIYGSIKVLCDDREMGYIFKRGENNALKLGEYMRSTPVLEGSRLFEDSSPLEMKFDIKDVESDLAIKGYVDWDASILDSYLWHEKQLCSLVQGEHGFAAVHYSIFSDAVGVNLKAYLNLKKGCVPKVCGSVITRYNCFDYSSRYNKDYYRIVLFNRTGDDSIEPSSDSMIPLSRSMVVVPSYASLLVNVDLSFWISGVKLSCVEEIEIKLGQGSKTLETSDWIFRLELEWCEIK